jgi:hypothetical protein
MMTILKHVFFLFQVLSLSTAGVSEGLSLGEEGNSTLGDEDTKLMQSDSGDM